MCPPQKYTHIPSGDINLLPKNKEDILKNAKSKKKLLESMKLDKIEKLLQEAIEWCEQIPTDDIDSIKLNDNQYLRLGMIVNDSEKIFNIHIFEKQADSNISVVSKIIISSSENDPDIDFDTKIINKNGSLVMGTQFPRH